MSINERRLIAALEARGVDPLVPQQAVGRYNIDVASWPVAVEIFGGSWHATGHHRRRTARRYRYLLDNGWAVLIIWCMEWFYDVSPAAIDYVVSHIEAVKADASLIGEYRIIRGDGQFVAKGRDDLQRIACLPSRRHKP